MNNEMFSTAPITLKYFSRSFFTKLIILNIKPKKQLAIVVAIKHLGIIGKFSFALIVAGIEFIRKKNKMKVNTENDRDNLEYGVLCKSASITLLSITIIHFVFSNFFLPALERCVQKGWRLTLNRFVKAGN
jgi:hypothetical protein